MKMLSDFQAGATVKYHGEPCIVLEHRKDGTLLMVLEQIEHTFGSDNDFAKSDLREHLNGAYMDTLTQGNHGEILKRAIDLTAVNGSKQYGIDTCCIAPLTFDEYRKYHDIIPKPEKWEWSVTPWSTPCVDGDETWVMGLNTNGNVGNNLCYNTYGSRPAFLLPSNYVVEPENALASADAAVPVKSDGSAVLPSSPLCAALCSSGYAPARRTSQPSQPLRQKHRCQQSRRLRSLRP